MRTRECCTHVHFPTDTAAAATIVSLQGHLAQWAVVQPKREVWRLQLPGHHVDPAVKGCQPCLETSGIRRATLAQARLDKTGGVPGSAGYVL